MSYAKTTGGVIRPDFADFRTGSVRFPGEQPGAVLTYDSQAHTWKGVVLGAGNTPFSNQSPAVNDSIVFDGLQWVPGTNRITHLADVDVSNPSTNQVLKWNGSRWINGSIPGPFYGTVQNVVAGGGLLGGNITISGVISLPNITAAEVPNTPGASIVTGITCDTYGRTTSYSTQPYVLPAAASNAQSGNVLIRDSATAPCNLSFATPGLANGFLKDVAVASPASLQTLKFNGTSWVNSSLSHSDLSDTVITNPGNKHVLQYNGTAWVNVINKIGTSAANTSLQDVTFSGLQSNHVLRFNGLLWVNTAITLSIMPEFSVASVSAGHVLKHNGTSWVNSPLSHSDLSDTLITNPGNKHVIQYNGTRWVNEINKIGTSSANTSLQDVTFSGLQSNHVLRFTGLGWNNSAVTLSIMPEFSVSGPVSGNFLRHNGTSWTNSSVSTGDVSDFQIISPAVGNFLKYVGGVWSNAQVNTADLNDFLLSTPSQGEILKYVTGKWRNSPLTSSDLGDFSVSAPATNHVIRYNGASWTNTALTHSLMSDTVITSPANKQVLKHNGTSWVNSAIDHTDLSDTSITNPGNKHVLQYNGSAWVNVINKIGTSSANTSLQDVTFSGLQSNHVLRFNGLLWANTAITLSIMPEFSVSGPAAGNFLQHNGTNWVNGPFTTTHVISYGYFSQGPTATSTFRVNNNNGTAESGINLIGGLSVDTPDNTAGVLWPLNNIGPVPPGYPDLSTTGGIFDLTTLPSECTLRIQAFCTFTQRTVTNKPPAKGMLYVKFGTSATNLVSGNNTNNRIGTVPSETADCIFPGNTVVIENDNQCNTCWVDCTVKNPRANGATRCAVFGYFESSAAGNRTGNYGVAVDGNNAMFRLGNLNIVNAGSSILGRTYYGQQIAGTNGNGNYPCGVWITITI